MPKIFCRSKKKIRNPYGDGGASVKDSLASDETLSSVHGDSPDHALTQMLSHLKNQTDRVVLDFKRRQDRRQTFVEPHVHHGSDDLAHLPDRSGSGELVGDLPIGGGRGGRRGLWSGLCRGGGGVLRDAGESVARRRWGGAADGGRDPRVRV